MPGGAWHPVVPSAELRPGANIVAGFAQDQELALWRARDGAPQAWENRCPHRSVRFTLGRLVEDRLACAYHGWEYAAGDGHCTRIPAHPDMPAPRSLCAKTYAAVDAAGMLWVRLGDGEAPAPAGLADAVDPGLSFCRTLGLHAPAERARATLGRLGFRAGNTPGAWHGSLAGLRGTALLLDARPALSFLHLWVDAAPGSPAMRQAHAAARALRADIEA